MRELKKMRGENGQAVLETTIMAMACASGIGLLLLLLAREARENVDGSATLSNAFDATTPVVGLWQDVVERERNRIPEWRQSHGLHMRAEGFGGLGSKR
jgi:hypothetical protein